ncbi:uncharacterized protein BDR25DRAFT_309603 [Lindgomyces ingoldianus]|uniref:Uncharacterized protein n=1 Tax=Lindgomyces ingoldianus TaxID=673940 RepID=A0ACB6RA59_9PLEO|nr:uncharacterized protein BDR25DRAFT_309603 [Lindgomyces ingoldianus]KAF2476158.1 hypothetical protein BDR25DRAFT_309603 [Lindgomyces ingoldianus]
MATATSPLLALPAELRNRIYDFYFSHDPTIPPPPILRSPLALSLACRQLHNETYSLAFASTTFRTNRWQCRELSAKISSIRSIFRPSIKRLEITVGIADFLIHPHSLDGLMLSQAGLSGLEHLYITFTGEPKSEKRETYIISNLENLLWATVAKCRNEHLSKIRIVHGGLLRWHGICELFDRMRRRLPLRFYYDGVWDIQPDFKEGRFRLINQDTNGAYKREVLVLMGHTAREAEMFRTIQQDLLEGKVLKHVCARRSDRIDPADMDNDILANEIDQLSRVFRMDNRIDTEGYY